MAGSATTTAPGRNSSVGGAYFTIAGHKLFLHSSGSNYNGGFTIKDMSANKASIFTQPVLGTGGYNANPTTGAWYAVEPIDENHCWLYEYCMGNGYAKYQVYVGEPYVDTPTGVQEVNTDKAVSHITYFNLSGMQSATPFEGVNIVVTTYTDGTRTAQKMMK